MRAALFAAAALFLAAHVISLPPSFEDLDSLNFAYGVRDFDVARHQPHPPGYPVYIALGKVSTAAASALGVAAPEVRGLAIWSAVAGALLVPLIAWLWTGVDGSSFRALAATALTVASPLFWFTALRPLSDMLGLAGSVAALAALARAWPTGRLEDGRRARWLLGGAAVAGFAIGIRSQTAVLTGPLLAATILLPWSRLSLAARGLAVVAFSVGVVAWGVPLVVASGGPTAYLDALSSQAGEDFAGVAMLWTQPTPKLAATALLDTFMRPWDAPLLAGVVLALAIGGSLVLRRTPRAALLVVVGFAPYLAFHLLFQESFTVRYALPMVLPVAFCAAAAIDEARRTPAVVTTATVCLAALALAVPAGVAFGRAPSPIVAALNAMRARPPKRFLGLHRRVATESRRARQWEPPPVEETLAAPRDLEWLELSRALRAAPQSAGWFLADPRRTDLALVDPHGRRVTSFRWPFNWRTYTGGARPNEVDLHGVDGPGWLLERGWALTPETAGIAAREGWGLDRQPGSGWVRRRPGAATLVIGGRHLATSSRVAGRVAVSLDGRAVAAFDVPPGPFLHWADVPPGALAGALGYAPLDVQVTALTDGDAPPVAIEQFDLQDAGTVMWAYDDGWQEPEYEPATGRAWRWMSARAAIAVRPVARDVVLRLRGENPRRYFGRAPAIDVRAGEVVLERLSPSRDFDLEVRVPAAALAAAGGRLIIESSESFVPGDRDGSADRRQLAARLFGVTVTAAAGAGASR